MKRRIPIAELSDEQLDGVVRKACTQTNEDPTFVRRVLSVMRAVGSNTPLTMDAIRACREPEVAPR